MKLIKDALLVIFLLILVATLIYSVRIFYPVENSVEGMAVKGTARLCVNRPPELDFSKCLNETSINEYYLCDVDAIDDGNNVTFSDDSELISINPFQGIFSFTPITTGNFTFEITVDDNSECQNSITSENFTIFVSDVTAEAERRGFERRSGSDGPNVYPDLTISYDIEVQIERSGETTVLLRLVNNGSLDLKNLIIDVYSLKGINVDISPSTIELLKAGESVELVLNFRAGIYSDDYDFFLFVEGPHNFNRHFKLRVNIKERTGIILDDTEFYNERIVDRYKYIYLLIDWITILIISTILFFVIKKLIHR